MTQPLTESCPACKARIGRPCKNRPAGQFHITRVGKAANRQDPKLAPRMKQMGRRGSTLKPESYHRTLQQDVARHLVASLRRLGYPSYTVYLESPHWKGFATSYKRAVGKPHFCWVCGRADYVLHHTNYTALGRETFDDVVALCAAHHKETHDRHVKGSPLNVAHLHTKTAFQGALENLRAWERQFGG